jgi:glycosyltransferase involved in cell wall biosynthesis
MSEYTLDDVSVVTGTYDEREAVGPVLAAIEDATDGRAEVVVVDSSSDGTAAVAREAGARVIEQAPRGYGVALLTGLRAAEGEVLITTDCDGTYPLERVPDLLALLNDGWDVVGGDRLYWGAAAMPRLNRLGNAGFALLASALLGARVHDATTGMRAYRREVIESIEWTENTGLSAELLLRPLARGYDVREIPIEYRDRLGETTLDPLSGGGAIARSILRVGAAERARAALPAALRNRI